MPAIGCCAFHGTVFCRGKKATHELEDIPYEDIPYDVRNSGAAADRDHHRARGMGARGAQRLVEPDPLSAAREDRERALGVREPAGRLYAELDDALPRVRRLRSGGGD